MKIQKYYKLVILVILILSLFLYKNIKEGFIFPHVEYIYSNRLIPNTVIVGNKNIIKIPNDTIITDPYDCFRTCVNTSDCGAYDMTNNMCNLKKLNKSKFRYNSNVHTYIVDKTRKTIDGAMNKKSVGNLLNTITGKTYTDCYYDCINDKNGCNSITIDFNPMNNSQSETGTCWLYSNVTGSIDASSGLIYTTLKDT
jgi:hypothetical protein